MDYLTQIKLKVQEKINLNHNIIVIAAYKQMINRHQSYCSCNYCIILRKYVNTIKEAKKVRRVLKNYDYSNVGVFVNHSQELSYLKLKIHNLKVDKDKLKQI